MEHAHRSTPPLAALVLLAGSLPAQPELKLVRDLRAHDAAATHVVFERDGRFVATAGHDRTVRIWDPETWELRHRLELDSQLWTVAISPDGKRLAAAGDFRVWVYAARRSRKAPWMQVEKLPIEGHGQPAGGSAFDLLFSRDGRQLFVGTSASTVDVWDTRRWKLSDRCDEHDGPDDGKMIEFLDAHPDGETIVSGGRTFATRILRVGKIPRPKGEKPGDRPRKGWTTVHAIPEKTGGHPAHRMCAQFSPDGRLLAVGGTDGVLQVFACDTWKELRAIRAHDGEFCAQLAFHPDGTRLLSAAGTLQLWDTETWKRIAAVDVGGETQHLAVSPDGRHAVLACVDGHLRVFAIPDGR